MFTIAIHSKVFLFIKAHGNVPVAWSSDNSCGIQIGTSRSVARPQSFDYLLYNGGLTKTQNSALRRSGAIRKARRGNYEPIGNATGHGSCNLNHPKALCPSAPTITHVRSQDAEADTTYRIESKSSPNIHPRLTISNRLANRQ
jgi:hypothetical protein